MHIHAHIVFIYLLSQQLELQNNKFITQHDFFLNDIRAYGHTFTYDFLLLTKLDFPCLHQPMSFLTIRDSFDSFFFGFCLNLVLLFGCFNFNCCCCCCCCCCSFGNGKILPCRFFLGLGGLNTIGAFLD